MYFDIIEWVTAVHCYISTDLVIYLMSANIDADLSLFL